MARAFAALAAVALLASAGALAQMTDFAGNKDPALFTRMPGYHLQMQTHVVEEPYGRYEFPVKGTVPETSSIEGHLLHYYYTFDPAKGAPPSSLQIVRNYQNAAKKIGGKVVWEDVRQQNQEQTTLLVAKEGKEVWVHVDPTNASWNYHLVLVEREAMTQDVVADAAAFKAALAAAGHVEVPGIYFDTGKADVKPESKAALLEIRKLLAENPGLEVWIVGHTDYTGTLQGNLSLSGARAAAVVKALAAMGVDQARLAAYGDGPYAPVASNRTEEGRSKNRRVELVERP